MPKATLPTTFRGWIVALVASVVGLLSGMVVIDLLDRWFR